MSMRIGPRKGAIMLRVHQCRPMGRQRGIALFVGLVFLVILTMVAVVSMRGTLLQMRLTTATAAHERAFEASETARSIPEALLVDHVFNRGWPVSWGGTVPDALFALGNTFANRPQWQKLLNPGTTSGQGLQKTPASCGGGLVSFYLPVPCTGQSDAYNYTPASWNPAVIFTTCDDGSTSCDSGAQITSTVAVIRDGVTVNTGSGAAMSQGYSSIGVGTAKGGSTLLLQLRSDAKAPGNGEAVTIAQYKLNIDH